MSLTELLVMARNYHADRDHLIHLSDDGDERRVAWLGDGWVLSDALEVIVADDGTTVCTCDSCWHDEVQP